MANIKFQAFWVGFIVVSFVPIQTTPMLPPSSWSFTTENILPPSAPTGLVVPGTSYQDTNVTDGVTYYKEEEV